MQIPILYFNSTSVASIFVIVEVDAGPPLADQAVAKSKYVPV
jgi:hypothetical protein